MSTLVIQSHTRPLPHDWLPACLESVRHWCRLNHYDYRFIDDRLFDGLPESIVEKTRQQKVIATDIARLQVIRSALAEGFDTVVWLDADFYIFHPRGFRLPEDDHAVGREVWIQDGGQGGLRVYKKVHNAFLMFRRGNSFLEFYLATALRMVRRNTGRMPDQFVGPKLLTALHNVAGLTVMETAGMLSPLVVNDLVDGGGVALDRFIERSPEPVAGANLCCSSINSGEVSPQRMKAVIDRLAQQGEPGQICPA